MFMKSNLQIFSTTMKLFILIITSLVISSCIKPETPTDEIPLDLQYTLAAQTVIAELTEKAPTSTALPNDKGTMTPTVTNTQPLSTRTTTSTPSETPTPQESIPSLPDYSVIYEHNFSNGNSWYTSEEDNYGFRATENAYQIYVNIQNAAIWSIYGGKRSNLRITTLAEQVSVHSDGYYGVTCRHQDGENYYGLVISNNREYGIIKMYQGELTFIQEGLADEGIINEQGDNEITADCINDTLVLYANGIKLAEIMDDSFNSGSMGLLAGTRKFGEIVVDFKQIQVLAP
jgi:hypothetical protein